MLKAFAVFAFVIDAGIAAETNQVTFLTAPDGIFPGPASNTVTTREPLNIFIGSSFPLGAIFYTTDGTAPSFLSTRYVGWFKVSSSVTIRAIAYSVDFAESATNSLTLVIADMHVDVPPPFQGLVTLDPPGGLYVSNTVVRATAKDGGGWSFENWDGPIKSSDRTIQFVVTNQTSLSPRFGTRVLTTGSTGGTVEVSSEVVHLDEVVQVTAVPDQTHYFGAWGGILNGNQNPTTFTVNGPTQLVSAAFAPLGPDQVTLVAIIDGPGSYRLFPQKNVFTKGEIVQLHYEAPIDVEPRFAYTFPGWTGDASGASGWVSILMDGNKTVRTAIQPRELRVHDGAGPAFDLKGRRYLTDDGSVFAFSAEGSLEWSLNLQGQLSAPAIGNSGTIYVSSANGDLFAISSAGAVLWKFTSGEGLTIPSFLKIPPSPTVMLDETVFSPSTQSGETYVVKDGGLVRVFAGIPAPTGGVEAPPPTPTIPLIGADGTIYMPTAIGFSAGILNRPPKWSMAGSVLNAIDSNGRLYSRSFTQVIATDFNGAQLWRADLSPQLLPQSLRIGESGVLYVGTSTGTVALDPNGGILWTNWITGAIAPTSDGGVLVANSIFTRDDRYNGHADVTLTRLSANGAVISTTTFREYSSRPLVLKSLLLSDDGTAFIVNESNNSIGAFDFAYEVATDARPARSSWTAERGNLQNNGRAVVPPPFLNVSRDGQMIHLRSSGISSNATLQRSADLRSWELFQTGATNVDLRLAPSGSAYFRLVTP